jgi:maltose alpha-D-glucosyltransferase/alpha-amylase
MHAILAAPTTDPEFAPEKCSKQAAERMVRRITAELEQAIATAMKSDDEDVVAVGRQLNERRKVHLQSVRSVARRAEGRLHTRIHGDLHLGQLLLAGDDVMIIDFEGEPTKTVADRRAKDDPLRDVAGMLRSFDYAAAHVERSLKLGSEEGVARAGTILREFRAISSGALLQGYEQQRGRRLNRDDHALVRLFMLEKAAYETGYEAANRPEQVIVPLTGVLTTAETLVRYEEAVDG